MEKIKIGLISGGVSNERNISIQSGKNVYNNIDRDKYEVIPIELTSSKEFVINKNLFDNTSYAPPIHNDSFSESKKIISSLAKIVSEDIDVFFIILHGKYGEDGIIQGLLDFLGYPYVGSNVLSSSICMDKEISRYIIEYNGFRVPKTYVLRKTYKKDKLMLERELSFPVVVKPNSEGSSFGVSIVNNYNLLIESINNLFNNYTEVLIEEYIEGTEISCPVYGNYNEEVFSLPVIEIVPKNKFFDFESKYSNDGAEEIVPARISKKVEEEAREIASKCHKILKCKGLSRVDIIIRGNDLFVLEVNTLPGMTENSLYSKSSLADGISFKDFLTKLITLSLKDTRSL